MAWYLVVLNSKDVGAEQQVAFDAMVTKCKK